MNNLNEFLNISSFNQSLYLDLSKNNINKFYTHKNKLNLENTKKIF